MRKILLFIVFGLFFIDADAALTTIKGVYSALKDREISVHYKKEGYTNREYILDKQKANSSGQFTLSFNIDKTQACTIELGKYKGTIFAEPGKIYEIDFAVLDTSKLNHPLIAFEVPITIILAVKNQNSSQLQFQISYFEERYQFYQTQVLINSQEDYAQQVVDASIKELDSIFKKPMAENTFLRDYIRCNYAMLQLQLPKQRANVVAKYLSHDYKNEINNPAFWDLMSLLWLNHMDHLNVDDRALYSRAILREDMNALKYIFTNHVGALDNMKWVNLALLEILYNERFNGDFPDKKIVSCIKKCKNISIERDFSSLCDELAYDVVLMSVGSLYPIDNLDAFPKGKISFIDYKGKFLLLYFFNSEMTMTNKDLNALKILKQKSKGRLEVVPVICFDTNKNIQDKLNDYKYDLNFAICKDIETLYKFQVFDLPTTTLFDKEGKVLSIKVPNPSDGLPAFIGQFYEKETVSNLNPFQ